MQWEGWRWAAFWSVGWGCLKASGAEKPGAVKSSILWQCWGGGQLPLPDPRQKDGPQTGRMQWWPELGHVQGPVLSFSLLYQIYWGIIESRKWSGSSLRPLYPSFYPFPLAQMLCTTICQWVLSPRHSLLLQLVPLTPSAISALLLLLVLGQPMLSPIFPNSISLYFLITQTNLSLYLPTITGFSVLLITPACQLSKKITYALNFPLTLINEWLQCYITCLCLACALLVWTSAIL